MVLEFGKGGLTNSDGITEDYRKINQVSYDHHSNERNLSNCV